MDIQVKYGLLNKGWKCFTIMHKNTKVVSIREDGTCVIYSKQFMPYNLCLELEDEPDLDVRINNLENFFYWCSSRVLTLDRKYAKEILNSIGAKQTLTDRDRAIISLTYHGVSFTDVYWIKRANENILFEDLNLFNYSLSNAFADVSLLGHQLTIQNSELIKPNDVAGDISTQGVAPKAWIRENGTFYLLKNGDVRDVEAELLASKIVSCFKVDSVQYERADFKNEIVSKSEIITSENLSIISMEWVDFYCANNNLNRDSFVLQKDSYNYYMMNIIDYLVGNTDRHWGNWGFLVDNDTNKIMKLYPLMDFNKSFTAYVTLEGSLCQTNSNHQSQLNAALDAVKNVGLNQIAEVEKTWFSNIDTCEMFFERLNLLRNYSNK